MTAIPREARDTESLGWLRRLSGTGQTRDEAVARLHVLALRAARFEIARRRVVAGGSGDADALAMQAADDAVATIMSELHTYRGDSRFTTWAYKFAVLEAAVGVRRREWEGRELPPEETGLARLEVDRRSRAVRDAIVAVLTPRETEVLVAITLNDVPIDVLAERCGTTRGALYETLQQARCTLRAELAERGFQTT